MRNLLYACLFLALCGACAPDHVGLTHINLSGEVTAESILLQSRLVATDSLVVDFGDDVQGVPGFAYFEMSLDSLFSQSQKTTAVRVDSTTDFIIKEEVTGLSPSTRYYYRLWSGVERTALMPGQLSSFVTLPGPQTEEPVTFSVISCMHFEKFFGKIEAGGGGKVDIERPELSAWERTNGFPALRTIKQLSPLFIAATGDNVYYDAPGRSAEPDALTRRELRAKWHRQFSMPIIQEVFREVPFYWEKDDHDYRFNDADTTNNQQAEPSHALGVATFREQVPLGEAYKTLRLNQYLQIWFVEGRDFRSPNDMSDGPDKSLWGHEQRDWLKTTLLQSDALFKILVSPTPMIGPDDAYKSDNHANFKGFRYERDEFFDWLNENGLEKNFVIINGDRHWQYHSVGPFGIQEFGTGALVRQNARYGRRPGDQKSTDPDAEVQQLFIQETPTGGFVHVKQQQSEGVPILSIDILDAEGNNLHSYTLN